jgi:hypothetical protein
VLHEFPVVPVQPGQVELADAGEGLGHLLRRPEVRAVPAGVKEGARGAGRAVNPGSRRDW